MNRMWRLAVVGLFSFFVGSGNAEAVIKLGTNDLRLRAVGDGYAQLQVGDSDTAASLGVGLAVDALPGAQPFVEGSVFYKRGSADEITGARSNFGNFLLSPATGAYCFSGDLNVYPWYLPADWGKWGFRGYIQSGKSEWVLSATGTDPEVRRSVVGSVGGVGLVTRLNLRNGNNGKDEKGNTVSLHAYVLGTVRTIRGDAGKDRDFLAATLNSTKRELYGYDVGAELRINDVFASVVYARTENANIDALTGGQLIISIGVRGGVEL